jgi:hypothetical protein
MRTSRGDLSRWFVRPNWHVPLRSALVGRETERVPYRAVLFALLVTIARLLVPGLASPDVAAADICGNQIGPTESGLSCGVEARVTDSLAGEVFGGGADPTGAGTADPGLPDAPGAPTCPDDGCFVSGTLVVTAQGMVPIEDIEVGDRVATACEGETQSSETEVDPATWRKVTLRIADVDGGVLEITALRPARWLAETGCVAGQQVWLEFPEMGAKGWALIDAVEACPPLGKGPGRVVLTTFRQLSNAVVRIWLDGPHEVVDATEGHPFWSVTHGEWRHAYQLVPGETLKTQSGSVTVLRVGELPGVFCIHNFEVEADHVYLASRRALLGHNPKGYSGRYRDGQRAYRTNVPRDTHQNPLPDPQASGAHSRLQKDARDPSRTYSATEFDDDGNPVQRIDFAGRRGDEVPHAHKWDGEKFGREKHGLDCKGK